MSEEYYYDDDYDQEYAEGYSAYDDDNEYYNSEYEDGYADGYEDAEEEYADEYVEEYVDDDDDVRYEELQESDHKKSSHSAGTDRSPHHARSHRCGNGTRRYEEGCDQTSPTTAYRKVLRLCQ